MEFHEWLRANGFDPEGVTDSQRVALQAAWRASQNAPPAPQPAPPPPPEPAARPGDPQSQPQPKPATGRSLDQIFADQRAEQDRQRQITDVTARTIRENPDMLEDLEAMSRAAVEERTSPEAYELAVLRAIRNRPTPVSRGGTRGGGMPADAEVIEAAVCRASGLRSLESAYKPDVLEASEKYWRHGLGLQELFLTYARQNGYRGLSANQPGPLLRAAFGGGGYDVRAGVGSPSLHSLSGVLSNVANKFMIEAFMGVDQTWRAIAATRNVSDFKQITSYSLTGDLNYEKLPPGGELKHGTVGAESYTNQADTYGRMLGIDRRDLINDDLGAFSRIGQRLGRGGALKLNLVFWGEFLDNSAFFTSGNNSAFSGADTALDLDALDDANQHFMDQTDPDGNPLGVMPRFLLVPTALTVTAWNLVNSTATGPVATGVGNTAATSQATTANYFNGRFTPISTPYLSNSSLTGNSTAAWYLLADPADVPVIEVAFLNGMQTPTVESADADFNILGVMFRGYHDFGVNLQEYRGGVRMAGS